jgi:hypothetical protein
MKDFFSGDTNVNSKKLSAQIVQNFWLSMNNDTIQSKNLQSHSSSEKKEVKAIYFFKWW